MTSDAVELQQWQTRDRGSTEEWLACTQRSHGACGRLARAAATARCRLHDAPRAAATSHQPWVHLPYMGLPQVESLIRDHEEGWTFSDDGAPTAPTLPAASAAASFRLDARTSSALRVSSHHIGPLLRDPTHSPWDPTCLRRGLWHPSGRKYKTNPASPAPKKQGSRVPNLMHTGMRMCV